MFRNKVPPCPSLTMNWVAPAARAPAISAFTSSVSSCRNRSCWGDPARPGPGATRVDPVARSWRELCVVGAPPRAPGFPPGGVAPPPGTPSHSGVDVDADPAALHILLQLLPGEPVLCHTEISR